MKVFFNSRTAIAGAIIGLLLVFLQFKEFELYWGAVFFYDSKRSIGEVLFFFLINFIGVIFEAGNETREKIWSDLVAELKWRAERKESGFLFIPLLLREREIDVKKFSLSERNFFVHVRLLKSSFFAIFLVYEVWLWYCIGFGLVLIGMEGFK